jgi:hypothetical protein
MKNIEVSYRASAGIIFVKLEIKWRHRLHHASCVSTFQDGFLRRSGSSTESNARLIGDCVDKCPLISQIKGGLLVIAYTCGAPATVHEIRDGTLQRYWTTWLHRLQRYYVETARNDDNEKNSAIKH